jgi:hypothetical protein
MKPFLGNHWGKNPTNDKTYFYRTPSLMGKIGHIMIEKFPDREMGGRVFLESRRAYYRDKSAPAEERDLCALTWPQDIDVVREVRRYWLELPNSPRRPVMILQNVRYYPSTKSAGNK